MSKKKIGVLVMAYGTPYTESDIEPYYTHIRHGRRPADELIQDLKEYRYEAIGGISPLGKITNSQANKLVEGLNKTQDEFEFELFIGLKHITPFIEDAVEDMEKAGIKEAISIVLAPHYSTFSIKSYNERAKKVADQYGIRIVSVDQWYDEPKFIDFWVEKVKATYTKMSEDEKDHSCVIFSAHSLPEKILQAGDPYPDQLTETARLIAEKAGVKEYAIGWQSEGQTGEPWLGPDVQDLTRDLHKEKGYKAFLYCPVGFVADHLEVLYDNDTECQIVCEEVGAAYYRPGMPNDEDEFIDALCDVVLKKAKE